MRYKLNTGQYIRVTKYKDGVHYKLVLEILNSKGRPNVKFIKRHERMELYLEPTMSVSAQDAQSITELMNSNSTFWHNLYLNTDVQ